MNSSTSRSRSAGRSLLPLGAALVLVLFFASSASAQGSGAVVRPDPPALEVGQGQVEKLDIVLENAQDVYGIEVRAKFDPAVIEIADADPSKDGVKMIPGDFVKPDFLVRNTADNQNGTLQYVITQVNPTPPANGTGTVLSVLIRGKALGKQTMFNIDFVDIADRHGRKLAVHSQNGTIQVVSPKPPTATPTVNATPTGTPTPTISAALTVTVTATQTTTPSKAIARSSAGTASRDDRLVTAGLVLVAGGGCVGALVLLGFAAFLILRRAPH